MTSKPFIKLHVRWLLAFVLTSCMGLAAAQTATITRSVNVRSGPNASLPTVTWLLTGTRVSVTGCTANWNWCDVTSGGERGWVYSRYLSMPLQGSAVTILKAGPALGLPVVEFALGPYWDEHYQRRMWFPQKARWQLHWDRQPAPRAWRGPAVAAS